MRTTDDLNPERFQPLGELVPKAPPAPPPSQESKPVGPYGIVTGADGRMKTTKESR